MRGLLVDLLPLRRSPDFRRLWWGSMLSSVGGQMTTFAIMLQVFNLTGSSFAVGAVGLVSAGPAIILGLLAGSVVDAVDRRKLVLVTSCCLALVSGALAVQAFAGSQHLWLLYLLVAVESSVNSVNAPAGRTFLARLLPAEQLSAGAALNMLSMHISLTIGPALAGAVTKWGGLRLCYVVDVISFAGALYGVARLPAMRPEGGAGRPGLKAVAEGLRYIRAHKVLGGALLTDVNSTVLAMPFALFPAINHQRFGGPQTLGFMWTAVAIGGILGSTLSGPVGRVVRQGRAMLLCGAVWGLALGGFGLVGSLWATLALLVVAGTADVLSVVFRTVVIQLATPDRFRGRVSAAEYVVGAAFPELGNFRAGSVAALASPAVSAVTGGLSCVAGAALIAVALPAFSRYRTTATVAAEQP